MKIGDLVISKASLWYFGSEKRKQRIGIILYMEEHEHIGTICSCWFEEIGYFEISIIGIELLEEKC